MTPIYHRHPVHRKNARDWCKFRLAFEGGSAFKNEYLRMRKGETGFTERKRNTPVPAFAKSAILEIARATHQRISKVTREKGDSTFVPASGGSIGGVDRTGRTMNAFLGREVIDDLLVIGKIGIYVDNIIPIGPTKADIKDTDHPYIYAYKAENILDWSFSTIEPNKLLYVLLQELIDEFDDEGFRVDTVPRYRHLYTKDNKVYCQFYNKSGNPSDSAGIEQNSAPIELDLKRIPFVIIDIETSLMADVADYQIAQMLLESCDINYAVKSNIPFYTEQRNRISDLDMYSDQMKGWPTNEQGEPVDPQDLTEEQRNQFEDRVRAIRIGNSVGRYYTGERPGFINPSAEPLRVSMEKQDKIKGNIRELVHLAVKQLGLRFQSEESKKMDESPLEAGLSYIGLVLESAENQIATIWAEYEGKTPAVVKYPITYQLLTEADRRVAVKEDSVIARVLPSSTFRKLMQVQIANTRLGHVVDAATMKIIEKEIMAASAPTLDSEELCKFVEAGLVSADLASKLLGFPDGEAAKAQEERAKRLQQQLQTQQPATPDMGTPDMNKENKHGAQNSDQNPDGGKATRGEGK